MKLTDKEIIEALDDGKTIQEDHGRSYRKNSCQKLEDAKTGRQESLWLHALTADYTIVEPEIDWEKVIKEKYLCKFWDDEVEPDNRSCQIGILNRNSQRVAFCCSNVGLFEHCRPLRADEAKLVTDEKELWK